MTPAGAPERNSFLTPAMHRFLSAIRNSDDEYAIQEGLAVYVDLERFHAGTVKRCLQFCLISEDPYSDPASHIWTLNEDGNKCLDDPKHIPAIVKAFAQRRQP